MPGKTATKDRRPPMKGGAKSSLPSLDCILRPRSVAVVGVSRAKTSLGRKILSNLLEFEFTGLVFPVNPRADVVHSMKCYRSVLKIPEPVDLAVIAVARDHVLKSVEECGKKGVKGLIVITAGFKEVGGEGAVLEEKLLRRVRHYGMRMVGPNCMGVVNTDPEIRLNASFSSATPIPGPVAFMSQSGALGDVILSDARALHLGISMFVSVGNRTDVSGNDLLEFWAHDSRVEIALAYLESFGDAKRFKAVARAFTRKKPIVMVKAGRTQAGARAASSHTGSLIERDFAAESLFEQSGVLRVPNIHSLFMLATAFVQKPHPKGGNIAIVTNAGGPGILATDAAIASGLTLATLSSSTRTALRKALPAEASVQNPVDIIATATPGNFGKALKLVAKDPAVDGIVAIFVSPIMVDVREVGQEVTAARKEMKKPLLCCLMGRERHREAIEELLSQGTPVYQYPETAVQAFASLVRYREIASEPQGKVVDVARDLPAARRIIRKATRAGRSALTSAEATRLLQVYGIPVAPGKEVSSVAEAIAFSIEVGYPVTLKILSESGVHKTDVGGIRLDLRNGDDVATAWNEMSSKFSSSSSKDHEIKGFLVQKMIRGGREVILGSLADPKFGPLILFGLGGIHVEVLKDVSVRTHPITDVDAQQMIRSIRGFPLLGKFRGSRQVDFATLEGCLMRLSQMAGDHPEIAEIDLNPLIACPKGKGSAVVDARILLHD